MGLTCIKHGKSMHRAWLREAESLIARQHEPVQHCYMMLIIGCNSLVISVLKVIIILNSVAARLLLVGKWFFAWVSGSKYKCLKVGILEEQLRLEDGLPLLLNVIKEAVTVKVASIQTFSTNHHKNVKWKHPFWN